MRQTRDFTISDRLSVSAYICWYNIHRIIGISIKDHIESVHVCLFVCMCVCLCACVFVCLHVCLLMCGGTVQTVLRLKIATSSEGKL